MPNINKRQMPNKCQTSGAFIVDFNQISNLFLEFLLLNLNRLTVPELTDYVTLSLHTRSIHFQKKPLKGSFSKN